MAKTGGRLSKNKKRFEIRIITFTILCLLVVASFGKMKLRSKNDVYIEKENIITAQLEEEKQRTEEIKELKKYMETKKYVEEVAKERLGLIYSDEILFKAKE